MDILTVYDGHVEPGQDLSRFLILAKLIEDKRPDVVVQGGDFATMESLSHWDKNKRMLIEGRRIIHDIYAAREAWDLVESGVRRVQERQRKLHERLYKPDLIFMEGNHENWIEQYVERNPEMEGMINFFEFMEVDESTWGNIKYVPWKQVEVLDGILFCHAPIGRTGPVHSKYITARTLADMVHTSIVFGHTHRNQSDSIARYDSGGELKYIRSVNAGCFFDEWPHYAKDNVNDYWQGCTLLHVYGEGKFDVEEWSLERMRYVYG